MRFCFSIVLGIGCAVAQAAGLPDRVDNARQAARPLPFKTAVRVDSRTGKLVRAVVQLRVRPETATPAFRETVEQIAAQQSVPAELIHSVIRAESNYNPYAVSPKGALGLMQLIPTTARRFGVSDAFDPVENIQGGAKYLRHLLDLYAGDYKLALAAYNAGEGAVAKYGDVPPYPETQNYVEAVGRRFQERRAVELKTSTNAGPPAASKAAEDGPAHIEQIFEADGTVRYVSR